MNVSALAGGALVCVVALLLVRPFNPEIPAGVRAGLALRVPRSAITLFGHLFLGATRAIGWGRAAIASLRKPAAKPIASRGSARETARMRALLGELAKTVGCQ